MATLDAQNPKDPQQVRPRAKRDTRGLGSPGRKAPREPQARESAEETHEGGADQPEAPTCNAEVDIRNFRINDDLLGKFGCSTGCPDCDATRHGGERRAHTATCRKRIEAALGEADPSDSILERRDRRFYRGLAGEEPDAACREVLTPNEEPPTPDPEAA